MDDQLSRIEAKLDRLLDPEQGVYAVLHEHKSEDALAHAATDAQLATHKKWLAIAVGSALAATGAHAPKLFDLVKTLLLP